MAYLPILFPEDVSAGARGGPGYDVTILPGPNGPGRKERRNQNVKQSCAEWEVGHLMHNDAKRDAVINFWHVAGGPEFSFRFWDPSDYLAGMSWQWVPDEIHGGEREALAHDGPHNFAVGDATETVYQLLKVYAVTPYKRVREIYKPRNDIKVYLDGVALTSGYSVDYETGLVTFTAAPGSGVAIGWSGRFDIPGRFAENLLDLTMLTAEAAEAPSIRIVEVDLEETWTE